MVPAQNYDAGGSKRFPVKMYLVNHSFVLQQLFVEGRFTFIWINDQNANQGSAQGFHTCPASGKFIRAWTGVEDQLAELWHI
jgi:hypothetical protein